MVEEGEEAEAAEASMAAEDRESSPPALKDYSDMALTNQVLHPDCRPVLEFRMVRPHTHQVDLVVGERERERERERELRPQDECLARAIVVFEYLCVCSVKLYFLTVLCLASRELLPPQLKVSKITAVLFKCMFLIFKYMGAGHAYIVSCYNTERQVGF